MTQLFEVQGFSKGRSDGSNPTAKDRSMVEAWSLGAATRAESSLGCKFLECKAIAYISLSPVTYTQPGVLHEWETPCDGKRDGSQSEGTSCGGQS